jgi:hypothetical protein
MSAGRLQRRQLFVCVLAMALLGATQGCNSGSNSDIDEIKRNVGQVKDELKQVQDDLKQARIHARQAAVLFEPEHLPGKVKFQPTTALPGIPVPHPAAGCSATDVVPLLKASSTVTDAVIKLNISLDPGSFSTGGSNPIFINIGCHTDNNQGNPYSWVDFTDSTASANTSVSGHKWVEVDNNDPVLFFHDIGPLTLTLHVYYYPSTLFPAGHNYVDLYIFISSNSLSAGSPKWTVLRVYRDGIPRPPQDPRIGMAQVAFPSTPTPAPGPGPAPTPSPGPTLDCTDDSLPPAYLPDMPLP